MLLVACVIGHRQKNNSNICVWLNIKFIGLKVALIKRKHDCKSDTMKIPAGR